MSDVVRVGVVSFRCFDLFFLLFVNIIRRIEMKHIVGFTGTQSGMVPEQKRQFKEILQIFHPITEFHPGDCIGADSDAHQIVHEQEIPIVLHPPTNKTKRAFCLTSTIIKELSPKSYLERNQDIVDACSVLIATPEGDCEEIRSGTWATIRRARKAGKPIYIIWPDGDLEIEYEK